MNTTIYMIRHTKSLFIFGQERMRELSQQGIIDAKKVTEIMNDKQVDLIVSSPYVMSIQTIEKNFY